MPLVTRQLASLFNGVSQQPAPLRLPSQHEVLDNVYCTVVDGIRKRPGSQHIARITTDLIGSQNGFIHAINRDVTERYIVTIAGGRLRVFDLSGNEKTVFMPTRHPWAAAMTVQTGRIVVPTTPNGYIFRALTGGVTGLTEPEWNTSAPGAQTVDSPTVTWEAIPDYLYSAKPNQDFAMVTVADYTFIVNKSVAVRTREAPTATPYNYDHWAFPPQWAPDSYWTPTYYYTPENVSLTGVVQTFADLPSDEDAIPPNEGDIYKVQGYDADNFSAFYVKRTGGVWVETYAPGQSIGFDELTMPHALVREADGTFTFTQFPWLVRHVGDNQSNPEPTFVGRPINDVFFYKNRLGFIADENVIFSEAGNFGNFWRTTVTDLLDSDPVDIAVGGKRVSKLLYAVPFEARLMLFADQTQFLLNVDQLLTPSSTSSDAVTEYEIQPDVRPVGVGADVYFVTPKGRNARVRQYFVQEETNSTDATDVTAHVPRYLPQHVLSMWGNANEDVLFLCTDDAGQQNKLWLYKWFYTDDGKVQSAWFTWTLDENARVVAGTAIENEIYVLIERNNGLDTGVYLEKFDLEEGATTGALDFEVLLDRQVEVTGVYQGAVPNTTRFMLPYAVPENVRPRFRIVKGADFVGANGQLIDPATYVWLDDMTVDVPGNQTAGECHAGIAYTMTWTLSEQFPIDGRGEVITTGRMQLRTITVFFVDTAYFKTRVDAYGNGVAVQDEEIVPAALSEFTGKTLGDASLITGEPNFATGTYRFQVYANSKTARISFINDTHVQSKFSSLEWEGLYSNRSQPM